MQIYRREKLKRKANWNRNWWLTFYCCFIYLKVSQREVIFHLLAHFLNGYNGWGLSKPKLGTWRAILFYSFLLCKWRGSKYWPGLTAFSGTSKREIKAFQNYWYPLSRTLRACSNTGVPGVTSCGYSHPCVLRSWEAGCSLSPFLFLFSPLPYRKKKEIWKQQS